MRSWATRSTNLYGPAQTGWAPKFSPAACAALGDTIVPAGPASWASNGAEGIDSTSLAVWSSITSTLVIALMSRLRVDPGIARARSILYLTAAASKGSPSWNLTPGRSLITSPLRPSVHAHSAASCGTISSSRPMSSSLSHSAVRTTPLTNVRLCAGSRVSGSSASPMRKVCAPAAPAISIDPANHAATSVRPFIIAVPPRSCLSSSAFGALHCSLELQPLRADQTVWQRGEAGQLVAERPQPFLMIEIHDRQVLERLLGDIAVIGETLVRCRDAARRVELAVDVRVAVAARIETGRRLARHEIIDVSIGVGAPAPTNRIGLEVAFCGKLQRGCELGRPDADIEAALARHRLNDLGGLQSLRVVHRHQLDHRVGRTRRGKQGLGLAYVASRDRKLFDVIWVGRGDPLVSRLVLAIEHDLVQSRTVDRQLERLTHPRILAQWRFRALAIGHIDGNPVVAEAGDRGELEARVLAHRAEIGGGGALDHIEPARPQIGEPHG